MSLATMSLATMSLATVLGSDAEEVARSLRAERVLIARVMDEMTAAMGSVLPPVGQRWQSAAQRAYAVRLDELHSLARAAWGQLAGARDILDRAILRLAASG